MFLSPSPFLFEMNTNVKKRMGLTEIQIISQPLINGAGAIVSKRAVGKWHRWGSLEQDAGPRSARDFQKAAIQAGEPSGKNNSISGCIFHGSKQPFPCPAFLFSLSLCPHSHYPPFLLPFFPFAFMSLLEEINFFFLFHWTKGLGDGGHISSCCRFSYSLAEKDVSFWKPKGGAVAKGES